MYNYSCEASMSRSSKRLSKNQVILRVAIALILIVIALFAIDRLAPYLDKNEDEPVE